MEWNFQTIIMVFATVVLVIMLTLVGIALSKAKSVSSWPPVISKCPDYWVDLGNGTCFNEKRLGKCNIPTDKNQNPMKFNVSPYNTSEGACAKYNWAKNCEVGWDGITYGASNPCVKPKA